MNPVPPPPPPAPKPTSVSLMQQLEEGVAPPIQRMSFSSKNGISKKTKESIKEIQESPLFGSEETH